MQENYWITKKKLFILKLLLIKQNIIEIWEPSWEIRATNSLLAVQYHLRSPSLYIYINVLPVTLNGSLNHLQPLLAEKATRSNLQH